MRKLIVIFLLFVGVCSQAQRVISIPNDETITNGDFLHRELGLWRSISASEVKTAIGLTIADIAGLQVAIDGKVPVTRTLTINGTAFDLSANRSWTITAGVWGQITGTLSDQTDLNTALGNKQNALGFTPENVANKSTSTSLGTSNSLYPTQNAVKTYVDAAISGGGFGTVTDFSAGDLSPLFTTSEATTTSTPALTFNLSNAVAHTFFGNSTGSTGAPSFTAITAADVPTLNQNTTGSAATLTTSRNIQGVSFNGSANIDIINGTGFVKASGTTLSYDNSTYLTTSSAASTYAPLASPALTGTPTAPTAATTTNTTQIATTAFVQQELDANVLNFDADDFGGDLGATPLYILKETSIVDGSLLPVTSNAIYDALALKLDVSTAASTYQPLDADLTTIAGLTPTTDNFMVATSSAWASRTPAQARTQLGATTVGANIFTLTNPSAVRFIKINADNSVTARTAAEMLSDIGAQAADADLTTYASITPTTVAQNLLALANPSAVRYIKIAADNTVSAVSTATVLSDIGAAASSHTHAISTDITGLGTGVATFLGTPSSANLASALTDETGTGVAVFGTSPTFTTMLTTPLIKITGGSPGSGKVLTSDADGDATWETPTGGSSVQMKTVTFDGQGGVVTVNSKMFFRAKSGTIVAWSILAEGASPTCTLDVWKIATGTALPTVANTIMGTKPALATGNAIYSTTLTSWTTSVSNEDIFYVNVDAVANATKIQFILYIQ